MRTLLALAVTLIVGVIGSSYSFAAEVTPKNFAPVSTSQEIRQLRLAIKNEADDIAILRRDEINYRVEKDLLKDAYSSNLQTINVVIAIIFGVITVIGGVFGYFGLKSLQTIKAEYAKDLELLRELKSKLEAEIAAVIAQQASVKDEVSTLAETNREQNNRIQVLEVIEKASTYFNNRNYHFALDFIAPGLALDPTNDRLMRLKALCHSRLGEFAAAIDMYNRILERVPDDIGTLVNLAETYLLANMPDKFDELYNTHRQILDKELAGALIVYLKAIRGFVKGDAKEIATTVLPYVETCSAGAAQRLPNWGYQEVKMVLQSTPDSPIKTIMQAVLEFFSGSRTVENLKPLLQAIGDANARTNLAQ